MTLVANWSYPTDVRFGVGRCVELPEICAEAGLHRPLLVTDHGLATSPMIENLIAHCQVKGLKITVFSDVKPNPVEVNILAGIEAFRAGSHDGVIAFGGGSGLDAGKLVAFMQAQTRPIWDFEDIGDGWRRANTTGIAPVIAVPTTAGTGSEVGRAAVVTNEKTHEKKIIFHPRMLPRFVIADPGLTVGLPPRLTAATGMDALAHNLEAYCAPSFHPMAAGIAIEGMRLARDWLAHAVRDGADLEARGHMLACSAMGSAAFQRGLGAIHALSHPLGGLYDAHHGTLNGVLMPYVLVANRAVITDRMARAAAYLGISGGFDGILDWVVSLRAEIGIPHTLAQLGIDDARLGEIGNMAVRDPSAHGNPVPFTPAQYAEIASNAMRGVL